MLPVPSRFVAAIDPAAVTWIAPEPVAMADVFACVNARPAFAMNAPSFRITSPSTLTSRSACSVSPPPGTLPPATRPSTTASALIVMSFVACSVTEVPLTSCRFSAAAFTV